MSIAERVLGWFGLNAVTLAAAGDAPSNSGTVPPRRSAFVAAESAFALSAFYRGVQVHATSICQLAITVERGGVAVPTPGIITDPDLEDDLSAFLEYTVVSFYVDGNSFWLKTFPAPGAAEPNRPVKLTPLNPREVGVYERRNERTGLNEIRFHYRGKDYTKREMVHMRYLIVPGRLRGLGPVEAARLTFEGALEVTEYGARWLSDASNPDGVLTTDDELKPGDAEKYKHVWYGRNPDGTAKTTESGFSARERLRVLGQGLHYEALTLKPEDVQFLETQNFNALEVARLIGAPPSLLYLALEGNSQTYANVEQEWIGYVRFSLMKPVRAIETALSRVLPRGQKARFNLEALLRSDTKTRYESHNLALEGGWKDADEVRAHEGMPPLTDDQRRRIAENRKSKPAATKEPAA